MNKLDKAINSVAKAEAMLQVLSRYLGETFNQAGCPDLQLLTDAVLDYVSEASDLLHCIDED